jgi:hypothetical protein
MKLLSHYPSPAVDLPVTPNCAAFGRPKLDLDQDMASQRNRSLPEQAR